MDIINDGVNYPGPKDSPSRNILIIANPQSARLMQIQLNPKAISSISSKKDSRKPIMK